jgi:hypothetical protein
MTNTGPVRRALPWLLLAGLIPVYWYAVRLPAFGLLHDDGIYINTAHALAHGRGYIVEGLPQEIPQTKYPFLYPAVLAAIFHFEKDASRAIFMVKLFGALCTFGWLALCYRYFRRLGSSAERAAWTIFFAGCSPLVLFLGTAALPDVLFGLFTVAALLVLSRIEQDPAAGSIRNGALAGVLAGAAFLTRTAGIALLPAAALALAYRRRWRAATAFCLLSGGLAAAWLAWQQARPAPTDKVHSYYSKVSYYEKGSFFRLQTNKQRAEVLAQNLASWLFVLHHHYGGDPKAGTMLLSVPVSLAALLGFFVYLRKSRNTFVLWLVLYSGMLVFWVWPPPRYAVPLVPFYAYFVWSGISGLVGKLRGRVRPPLAAASLLAALLVAAAFGLAERLNKAAGSGGVSFSSLQTDDWGAIQRMAAWIRENTAPDEVLAANLDPVFHRLTGRKAIRLWEYDQYRLIYGDRRLASLPIGTTGDLQRHIVGNRIRYILNTPHEAYPEKHHWRKMLLDVRKACPEAFRHRVREEDIEYSIYEIYPDRLAGCRVGP